MDEKPQKRQHEPLRITVMLIAAVVIAVAIFWMMRAVGDITSDIFSAGTHR